MRLPSGSLTIEMRAVVPSVTGARRFAAAVRQHEGVLLVDLEDLEGDVAPALARRRSVCRRIGESAPTISRLSPPRNAAPPSRALRPAPAPRCRSAVGGQVAHGQPHADLA